MLDLNLSTISTRYLRYLPSLDKWQLGKDDFDMKAKQITLLPATVKTGWGKMAEGQAPEWTWDEAPGRRGSQPSMDHKRGFAITLLVDGEETDWSSTGTGPVMGFQTLFSDVQAGMANNPGKVPVIEYTSSEAHKVGKGTTRKPLFKIVKWVSLGGSPAASSAKSDDDEF